MVTTEDAFIVTLSGIVETICFIKKLLSFLVRQTLQALILVRNVFIDPQT